MNRCSIITIKTKHDSVYAWHEIDFFADCLQIDKSVQAHPGSPTEVTTHDVIEKVSDIIFL